MSLVRYRINGTPSFGFASAVAEALENRNFPQPQVDNYSSKKVERTTIYFGKNAIAQAYTLNSNFTDTMMVMESMSTPIRPYSARCQLTW